MKVTPSRIALTSSTLFICLALSAKIGERRLAADRDDWVRNDSTLTAHTIHCPQDSIRLECPPPWVKWYEVDFTDPETGECIFADIGLMPDTAGDAYDFICTALQHGHKSDNPGQHPTLIASVTYRFVPDPAQLQYSHDDNFQMFMIVDKNMNCEQMASRKMHWLDQLNKQNTLPIDSLDHWYDNLPQIINGFYYQHSAAGSFEKNIWDSHITQKSSPNTQYSHPGPRWSKGLWQTKIVFHGFNLRTFSTTAALEDTIPGIVMQYYRDLNRRYAQDIL